MTLEIEFEYRKGQKSLSCPSFKVTAHNMSQKCSQLSM